MTAKKSTIYWYSKLTFPSLRRNLILQVRVWKLLSTSQVLVASLKEHKGKVTAVHLTRDDRSATMAKSFI